MSRGLRLVAVAAVAGTLASGCGFSLYDKQLPGAVRGSLKVTAYFDNATDLVPQAAVKVADVTVGSVTKVRLVDCATTPGCQTNGERKFVARVDMAMSSHVRVPTNAVAILQKTSLLGEEFVELQAPASNASSQLMTVARGKAGQNVIPDNGQTQTYPDLEEVFGVLATVLNGGGLEKIQTISFELSKALAGRESDVRDLLTQLDTLLGSLDQQKAEIVRALNELDALTTTLARQRNTIAVALDDLGPGLKILADNRANLTRMLTGLSRLGKVGSRVINASEADTVASLQKLAPILGELKAAGADFPRNLSLLLDYPFPDNSVNGIPGDYTNLYVTLVLGCKQLSAATISIPACPTLPTAGTKHGAATGTKGKGGTKPQGNGQSVLGGLLNKLVPPNLPTPLPSLPSLLGVVP